MLLFKAAQARNLTVMLEALANGADPNWVNEEEEGRTPLMKAVETSKLICFSTLLIFKHKNLLYTFLLHLLIIFFSSAYYTDVVIIW
jgi:hypothetical protein